MFVLGGKDFIVNSNVRKRLAYFGWWKSDSVSLQRVIRYLESHGVKKGLLYTPEHTHGQALLNGSDVFNKVMNWLAEG